MRESLLSLEHFGPFHTPQHKLQPGMTQSMVFDISNEGPCYMTVEERTKHKYDIEYDKTRSKKLTVPQLIEVLKSAGYIDPKGRAEKL